MNSSNSKGFLSRHGAALIDAGYHIIPIKRGEKRPPFTAWEKIRADKAKLREWLEDGYGSCGVGIIAAETPAVDIDIRDQDVAEHMEEWIHDNVAMAPVRVGHAPKRLLMFRTDEPFRKLKSTIYVDEFDDEHAVEILGDGQQFVAFHVHPETGKPYEWLYKDGPLVTTHDDLPVLTSEAAKSIIDEFERVAKEQGWKPKKKTSALTTTSHGRIADDVFAADTPIADISEDELYANLLMVPGADDYDTWLQIGMALYHQFNGSERGLDWWHEWSSTADNYDPDALDEKWPTFNADAKHRAPVTARLIIKLAKQHAEELATEKLDEVTSELRDARTLKDLKAVAQQVKSIEFDVPTRAQIVGTLRERFKAITGQVLGIREARDMVRYENPDSSDLPRWLDGWMYLSDEDRFFNSKRQALMTQQAFNTAFSRCVLTKKDVAEGRAHPERLPADLAMNIHQIPVVGGRLYMPGMDDIFSMNGVRYANTFSAAEQPEVPDELSKRDRRNVEIVERHFAHLFTIERDRELFKDWLAFIVQNPGRHPNWAVMMQGTEQDGKTFFGMMMGAVLGSSNITIVDTKLLDDKFTAFAEGHQLAFIEEVKLHGHNRYDVLNRIKPLITNTAISIRRMQKDSYVAPNMTSYLLATNFRDALPLNDNDSRYFVVFSRFQTQTALRAFKAANPHYYKDLYNAIEESPGAIRGWLLNRKLGENFEPYGRAPDSTARRYMIMMAKPEEQEAIEDILDTSMRFDMSRTLLSATDLLEEMYALDSIEVPQTKTINKILSDMGFTFLGRVRVDGRLRRYWTTTPEKFIQDGTVDTDAVRNFAKMSL